ncbi:MAG: NTP transferase domain-containing protein [Alphaproteobacteria bacterium]|nr:NTP transferase domain-containing protein [Alphaproteobacteria bacterium]
MTHRRYTALVLAGRRGGVDPVAASEAVTHKALALAGGKPLIVGVVEALRGAASVADIMVATDDREIVAAVHSLTVVPTAASPAATVARVLREQPSLLVTTADHGLLSPSLIETFCARVPDPSDVVVGVVPRRALVGQPNRRTFYRLADEAYCGANLYAFTGARGGVAATFWAGLEAERKHPLRLAARIGPATLLRYATRRLDLAAAFALLSRRAGAVIAPVVLDDPDAALDVDTPEDLALVRARLSDSRRCGRSP